MNSNISFTARKEIERNQLPQLLQKYEKSNSYETEILNNFENGFIAREARGTYVARIIKGIALTAFSFGIAYIASESVRELFNERKVKLFTCKAEDEVKVENDPQLAVEPETLIVQIEPPIQLEEPIEPLVETLEEEIMALEVPQAEPSVKAAEPQAPAIEPKAEIETKPLDVLDVIVQKEPTSSQSEEEEEKVPHAPKREAPLPPSMQKEPAPPTRMAPAIPTQAKREPVALPSASESKLRAGFLPSQVQVGATIFEEREILPSADEKKLLALCSELKEKSRTNLADQNFTLAALRRERKSSIIGTELLDRMIAVLVKLVETSETLSQSFNKAKSADDITSIYLSDAFSRYSTATNAFMAYYQAAERKCKKDGIYVRSKRDEIQSTYQLMVRHREFARELRALNVSNAATAFERVEKYTLDMNEALVIAKQARPAEESIFDRMEVFFETVIK